jgi:hypothetical protein
MAQKENVPPDPELARQPDRRLSLIGPVTFLLFLLLIAAIGWLWSASSPVSDSIYLQDRTFLQTLTTNRVTTIQIGRHCTVPASKTSAFVDAVHTLADFQVNHDLGAYLGVLTLRVQSGEDERFRLYEHPRGIVIEFYRGDDDNAYGQKGSIGYSVHGYVVSQKLAAVLAGIDTHCV